MADPVLFKNAFVGYSTSTAAAYVELPGVKEVTLGISRAELANSVMGDDAETFYPGLLSVPVSIVMRQDFTTNGPDENLWPQFNNRTRGRLKIRPVDAAVSTTNPSYILPGCYVTQLTPVSGSHGVLLEQRAEFRLASGHTFTRSTST